MPLRFPKGVYARGSMDWFYQDLAIASLTGAGTVFGCDAFLLNDATDGSSFFLYGLAIDASQCYAPFRLGTLTPQIIDLVPVGSAQSVVQGQAAPAGSLWQRGDESAANTSLPVVVCEANRMRVIDSTWPLMVIPPGQYAALNANDPGATYFNVTFYYLVLKES